MQSVKHIAITLTVPQPAPNFATVEELVEQIQLQLPRGVAVHQVIELTEALHSVLTRTRSANLADSLATVPRRKLAVAR